MTKTTVLHFASPFAFSMPVPLPVPRAGHGGSNPIEASAGPAEAALSLTAEPPLAGDAAATASEGAGFEASLLDTVLRRYREQDGPGPDVRATKDKDSA